MLIIIFFLFTISAIRTKKRIDSLHNYQFDNWILKISLSHDIDEFNFLSKKNYQKLDNFYLNTFFVGNLVNSLAEIASEDHAEFYWSILIKRTAVFYWALRYRNICLRMASILGHEGMTSCMYLVRADFSSFNPRYISHSEQRSKNHPNL